MKKIWLLLIYMNLLFVLGQNQQVDDIEPILEVPVVFHLVHPDFPTIDIENEWFEKVIDTINSGFNKSNTSGIYEEFVDNVAYCNIKFYLAFENTDCNFSSITRHRLNEAKFINSNDIGDNEKLKQFSYADPDKYLNIWVVPLSNRGGFEMNALVGEGAIIDYNHFINEDYVQYSTVHEIGHVLNLNHIWGGLRIDFFNRNCQIDDDVNDTPKQRKLNVYGTKRAIDAEPACDENEASVSNWQNFMDYSYHIGMFTKGQKARMRNFIIEEKKGYLSVPSCEEVTIVQDDNGKREYLDRNKLLYHFLALSNHQPTDYVVSQYLEKNDSKDYSSYHNNEFELRRRIAQEKKDIMKEVGRVNLHSTYIEKGKITIGKYSFENQSYSLQRNGSDLFSNLNSKAPFGTYGRFKFPNRINKKYDRDPTRVILINCEVFKEIKLPPRDAENLKNNLNYNYIHFTFEYKILPLTTRYNRSKRIFAMLGYVTKVNFYSDDTLSNLVYSIDVSRRMPVFNNAQIAELSDWTGRNSLSNYKILPRN